MMSGILKKQYCAVFIVCHAILRRIPHPSVLGCICHPSLYFTEYSSSVMLLQALRICIIIEA
jgi:hypothetical protein